MKTRHLVEAMCVSLAWIALACGGATSASAPTDAGRDDAASADGSTGGGDGAYSEGAAMDAGPGPDGPLAADAAGDAPLLCSDDAGSFPGPAGTCELQPCPAGCACIRMSGFGVCHCLGARPPDGGQACFAPTCGTIFCDPSCTCAAAPEPPGTCICGGEM
jgi:hypothetical protein